jgi:hypothetical protein
LDAYKLNLYIHDSKTAQTRGPFAVANVMDLWTQETNTKPIIAGTVSVVFGLAMIAHLVIWQWRRRRANIHGADQNPPTVRDQEQELTGPIKDPQAQIQDGVISQQNEREMAIYYSYSMNSLESLFFYSFVDKIAYRSEFGAIYRFSLVGSPTDHRNFSCCWFFSWRLKTTPLFFLSC